MSTKAIFEPVGHESLADAVVSQIEDLIASGILKQGRKLPSERDLAEMLRVSRPKLREALAALEERGLVTTQHGEGTFVAALTGQAMLPALLSLYERHEPAFFDYLEYRREQEGFAARLAARRATKADKERIAEILAENQRAWEENDAVASREADFALHSAIVDASQNATLIHMMASIYELTKQGVFYNRSFLKSIDGSGKKLLEQHLELGQAVIDSDEERAEQAAFAHIDFVEDSFKLGIEQQRREAMAEKRRILSR
ncbi:MULTISPECIES: FadR/GntR family transcriptional regulator [unclassified Ruegeria]|uniref:FadR/GntR family transcriptional regulator n=1 Tax=unclassified Ruegeria TaxID=2625375 RepID=UPI0014894C55|nr:MULTISPECIES: FadR/GntR family transcriptional regulator [unclassified Ruegeria]NOD75785.1 FCD domain-containing protein [Ruegeria sp. HKCCD4332]NOD88904.1 FCD domain-containing protein [Ruegeria sp. HKCCD4318]NOE14510.1 FCD domain-containing protein [Ruegeria sp. HKCCD4318-2]NOG09969.1 FadR family transcriptional regulator [Ruegeria sp. HKCCD4315]